MAGQRERPGKGGPGAWGGGGRDQVWDRGAGQGPLTGFRRVHSQPPPPPTGARTRAQAGPRPRPEPRTFGFPAPQTRGGARGRPAGRRREEEEVARAAEQGGQALAQPAPPALRPVRGGRMRGRRLSYPRRLGRRARAGAAEGRGLRGAG